MYKSKVLIIANRKEFSIKYKKLIENLGQDALIAKDLSNAISIIQNEEIEFLIISDTIKEKLSDFIKKTRILTYNTRPIIIAVSKSSDLNDRLETLEAGADDFLGEEITKQEFQMRFKAHLRRYIESSINSITGLLNKNITIKAIKKSIIELKPFSYLLIRIKDIDTYRKTHGEIAFEKVLQTLSAIINSTLSPDDFIGHLQESDFILITNPIQAEKIASFLTFAFDNILNKFYSSDEFENNFTIQSDETKQETKQSLMRLNIAITEKNENENDYREILNNLNNLIELCKDSHSSAYVIDRIKLKGEVTKKEKKNKVLILEPDEALSCLLKNVCELEGIKAEITLNKKDFEKIYKAFSPNVVIIDWGNKEKENHLNLAKKISKDDVKIIFSSSFLNKKEILKAGADLYIPKPYEIFDIINWIKKFLN